MLYAQFTHSLGLNDVCDALRANRSRVASIRGATPPSRNGLSHANKKRSSKMAEELLLEDERLPPVASAWVWRDRLLQASAPIQANGLCH